MPSSQAVQTELPSRRWETLRSAGALLAGTTHTVPLLAVPWSSWITQDTFACPGLTLKIKTNEHYPRVSASASLYAIYAVPL